MLPGTSGNAIGHRGGSQAPRIALLRDQQSCIPLTRLLGDGDILVLLTPVVVPVQPASNSASDPFEPLGRALATRHPWIRHVPYTTRNGVTSTHAGFIKRAKAVIFVISGPSSAGQSSQIDIAQVARMVGGQRPQITVACRNSHDTKLTEAEFPTVIQLPGYLPADLQAAAAVLFGESVTGGTGEMKIQELITAPKFWPPEDWDALDVTPVMELWNQCLPDQFHLEKFPLRALLQRDGYAMHFIVRLPDSREMVGFCATYTTFVDKAGERLIGSIAMIIVKSPFRGRGIGLSLFEHAHRQLKRIRGIDRIQLGSTFPRLLSGIPVGFSSEQWFERRGWQMDQQGPGRGQDICDWLLNMEDWPTVGVLTASAGLTFRQGNFEDLDSILAFVEKESAHKDYTGWYDQYMNVAHDGRLNDIILGIERTRIVASAMIYTPHEGSPLAIDIPWARSIGPDVGGATCICITDDPAMTSSKDTIMIRLLDTCITTLRGHGMKRIFLDAVKGGYEGFQSMGFQKWAKYKELWQPM